MISSIQELIGVLGGLVNMLIPFAIGFALLFFFWGLAIFVKESEDGKKTEEGRRKMIWGVVILFVMVSIWGIIAFLQKDLLFFVGGNTTELSPKPNQ